MRRRRRYPQPGRGAGIAAKLLTGMAVMLIVVVLVDLRVRPVVEDIIGYQARLAAFRAVNDTVLQEMESAGYAYDDIVRVTRSQDGSVASIQTDIVAVNRLKSRVAGAVAAQLEDPENRSITVPVGTLLGSQITSGRGPGVEVQVIPAGYVQSELYNQFTSAGINQTLHQIYLETTVQMVAVLPGYTIRTETSTSFCIAETVIVGAIPDGYTIVGEDGRSVLSKVNDYRVE